MVVDGAFVRERVKSQRAGADGVAKGEEACVLDEQSLRVQLDHSPTSWLYSSRRE